MHKSTIVRRAAEMLDIELGTTEWRQHIDAETVNAWSVVDCPLAQIGAGMFDGTTYSELVERLEARFIKKSGDENDFIIAEAFANEETNEAWKEYLTA